MASERKRLQKRHRLVAAEWNNRAIPDKSPKGMDNF